MREYTDLQVKLFALDCTFPRYLLNFMDKLGKHLFLRLGLREKVRCLKEFVNELLIATGYPC